MTNPLIKNEDVLLAIDPGTSKIGIAILRSNGSVLDKRIIRKNENPDSVLNEILGNYKPTTIVIGNGTGYEKIKQVIESITQSNIQVIIFDETDSTREARKNYFNRYNPLKRFFLTIGYLFGFSRIDLDDDVAVIIGKRYLDTKK